MGPRQGRAAVWVLVGLAVLGLAWLAVPVHVLARALLFLAVLGIGLGVLVGAGSVTERLLPWSVGLLVLAVGWPVLQSAVRAVVAGLPPVTATGSTRDFVLSGLAYDLTTCLLVSGLVLFAAVVLLLSARIRASLPPEPAPPRPTVRRRARLVEPHAEVRDAPPRVEARDPGDDDHGLLRGGPHGR